MNKNTKRILLESTVMAIALGTILSSKNLSEEDAYLKSANVLAWTEIMSAMVYVSTEDKEIEKCLELRNKNNVK